VSARRWARWTRSWQRWRTCCHTSATCSAWVSTQHCSSRLGHRAAASAGTCTATDVHLSAVSPCGSWSASSCDMKHCIASHVASTLLGIAAGSRTCCVCVRVFCCPCALAGVPGIAQLLASSVWQHVTQQLLLKPLMQPAAASAAAAAPLQQQQLRPGVAAGSSRGPGSVLGSPSGFKSGSPTSYKGSAWGSQGPPGSWQAGEPQCGAQQQVWYAQLSLKLPDGQLLCMHTEGRHGSSKRCIGGG
jgi:hypothetical protein